MRTLPVVFFLLTLLCLHVTAQPVVESTPVTVESTPLAPVQQVGQDTSIAASLYTVPGVTVVTQGQPVGQTDLSIRGSGFSGAGLSIAGLALTHAQTEHFNAELPFPAVWLGQPEVLTGVRQAAETEGHLTGTVHLMLLPALPGSRITTGLDNKSGYWVNANRQQIIGADDAGNVETLGVFAGHSEIPSVDFDDNDIQATRGGFRLQASGDTHQADLLLGYQDKTFGARGYYGVSDSLKAEETTEDLLLLGSLQLLNPGQTTFSLALRQFDDDYKLWLPSSLFRNQHTTRTAAAQASHLFEVNDRIQIKTRVAADLEDIDSTALGDFDRSRLSATVLPSFQVTDQVVLLVGIRGEVLEGEDNALLPLARLELTPSDKLLLFAEVSESVRRPSYTELNYESPGSLGNAGLEVQEQTGWEAGLKWQACEWAHLRASVFEQQTDNAVDWVRPDAEATRWQAANLGDIDTLGAETVLDLRLQDNLTLTTRYQWLDKQAEDPPYSSRYFLDVPTHLVTARLDWQISSLARFELSQLWREQQANALRTEGGDTQWLSQLALHLRVPGWEEAQLSLMASNALDDDYRTFPGQNTVSSRRLSAALTLDW